VGLNGSEEAVFEGAPFGENWHRHGVREAAKGQDHLGLGQLLGERELGGADEGAEVNGVGQLLNPSAGTGAVVAGGQILQNHFHSQLTFGKSNRVTGAEGAEGWGHSISAQTHPPGPSRGSCRINTPNVRCYADCKTGESLKETGEPPMRGMSSGCCEGARGSAVALPGLLAFRHPAATARTKVKAG